MKIQLITIGNELLNGMTINTNAALVARKLGDIGYALDRVITVGDTIEDIVAALKEASSRGECIIITGGLGPTPDDVTREAAARTFGVDLVFDEEVFHQIEKRWIERGKTAPPSAKTLSMIPEGSRIIQNRVGAAAGMMMDVESRLYFFLAGVPQELESMMENPVLTIIQDRLGGKAIQYKTLRIAGLGESAVHEKLALEDCSLDGVTIAYLPQQYEVHLRLTVSGKSAKEAETRLAWVEKVVRDRLEHYIYGVDDQPLESAVADLLFDRKLTVAAAESCTGGLVTDRLTNISGSSRYVKGSVIVYTIWAKKELLSVPAEIVDTFGPVSQETTKAMAEQIRTLGQTDLGLGITGVMGPTGGTEGTPVGTTYVALSHARETVCHQFRFVGDRLVNKQLAAQAALNELRLFLLNMPGN